MTTYIQLGTIPSSSSPGTVYEVSTEGTRLTCNCPGWTRQVHYESCPAVLYGDKCDCRSRPMRHGDDSKTARTCKHIRDVQPRVDAAGGIQAALRLITQGVDFGNPATLARYERVQAALSETARARTSRRRTVAPIQCSALGCSRPVPLGEMYCTLHRRAPAIAVARREAVAVVQSAIAAMPTDSPYRRAIRIREEDDE